MDTPEPVTNESPSDVSVEASVTSPTTGAEDCYECRACGYVYEPGKGDSNGKIAPNTAFDDLTPNWRCPVCGARKKAFANIGPVGSASGFKENLGFGFGVNTLTPTQKNLLIFGSLLLGLVFMLSLYGLG